jgi:RNA polymerase sigma factor (sigma-70 family)
MANVPTSPVGRFIRRLSVAHLVAAVPDHELIERFAVYHEEAAFAALVRRHGPLVLGVCRRVLTDPHAAEDCFQATFLILARKARSLRGPKSLGSWLYGVATRTALKARAQAARRRVCERHAAVAEAVTPADGLVWKDLRPKLDEAIAGLPEKYRTPFVLHYLEGLTVAQVAHQLGCPSGTTSVRLARAREQLRARLARQGLAWGIGTLATALAPGAASAAWPTLFADTVQAAMRIAAGELAGALSVPAAALTTGGFRVMGVSKVKVALAVLLSVSVLGVGVGVSQRTRTVGAHAGDGRAATPGDSQANGIQQACGDEVVFERFYAGGFRSLRGFEFRSAPPKTGKTGSCEEWDAPDRECKDILVDVQEGRTGNLIFGLGVNSEASLQGSIVLNERNFDLRQPLPRDPGCRSPIQANDPLNRAAPQDEGAMQQPASGSDFRVPAGAGLRIKVSPLGPVLKKSKDPEQLFDFWIGIFS